MRTEELAAIAMLIRSQRVASLGTLQNGAPFVSLVAYAAEPDLLGMLLHLSDLAPHTRQLRADARASLMIAEADGASVDDPQTLARLTLHGVVEPILRDTEAYARGRERYLARHPAAAQLFDFGDFNLFRFIPAGARFVGGFARAFTLTLDHLRVAGETDS
jgi:hypothetical protein